MLHNWIIFYFSCCKKKSSLYFFHLIRVCVYCMRLGVFVCVCVVKENSYLCATDFLTIFATQFIMYKFSNIYTYIGMYVIIQACRVNYVIICVCMCINICKLRLLCVRSGHFSNCLHLIFCLLLLQLFFYALIFCLRYNFCF